MKKIRKTKAKPKIGAMPSIDAMLSQLASIFLLYDVPWSSSQASLKAGYCKAAEQSLKRRGKKASQREIYRITGVSPEAQRDLRTVAGSDETGFGAYSGEDCPLIRLKVAA